MDQLWSAARGSAPAAPPGHGYALGEQVAGVPLGSQPIASDLPAHIKSAKVADRVRALAVQKADLSWLKLQDEVKVQKLVWESLLLTKGKEKKAEIAAMAPQVDRVLEVKRAGDTVGALAFLEEVVRAADLSGEILGNSTLAAARDIIKQDSLVASRRQLAERLDMAGIPATLPHTDSDKKELDCFVIACELADAKLERRIREVLLLPVPVDLGAPVSAAKRSSSLGGAVSVTASKKLSNLVSLGAPVSVATSRKLSQLVGAPAGSRHKSSLRGPSMSNMVAATESLRSDMPPTMKAGTAAAKVRALANDSPGLAWEKLEAEFEVQKLVWQSLVVTKGKSNKNLQGDIDALQGKIEGILSMKSADSTTALAILEDLLPKGEEVSELLNMGVQTAAEDVLAQHRLAPWRWQLAERLFTAGIPATLPRGEAEKKQMEALVEKCELGDAKLALVVRQMLLLVAPALLGAPATAKKTVSLGAGATGRRSSSMGTLSRPPVSESQVPRFQPAPRIMESI